METGAVSVDPALWFVFVFMFDERRVQRGCDSPGAPAFRNPWQRARAALAARLEELLTVDVAELGPAARDLRAAWCGRLVRPRAGLENL